MSFSTRLTNVEAGYAEVVRTDSNRRIGSVRKLDPYEVVSGTRWVARRNGKLTHAETRSEAVQALVAMVEAEAAMRASFLR